MKHLINISYLGMYKGLMEPQLSLEEALDLTRYADGLLLLDSLPALSLPFVCEVNGSAKLVSHFERARNDYLQAVLQEGIARVCFVVGFHYIDPEWISRVPHAPTEVKAVFEFRGKIKILERAANLTLEMLGRVTEHKQLVYASNSKFQVSSLPENYTERLLPHIVEFTIEPEELHVSRLMVLQHLSISQRKEVINKLQTLGDSTARVAIELIERFC